MCIFNKNAYPLLVENNSIYIDIDTQEDFDYAEYLTTKKWIVS